METTKTIRIAIYTTVCVLVLILLGIGSYIFFISGQTAQFVPVQTVSIGGTTSTEVGTPFNTKVLETSEYKSLNKTLFEEKKVPVAVPATRGKANLFGI